MFFIAVKMRKKLIMNKMVMKSNNRSLMLINYRGVILIWSNMRNYCMKSMFK